MSYELASKSPTWNHCLRSSSSREETISSACRSSGCSVLSACTTDLPVETQVIRACAADDTLATASKIGGSSSTDMRYAASPSEIPANADNCSGVSIPKGKRMALRLSRNVLIGNHKHNPGRLSVVDVRQPTDERTDFPRRAAGSVKKTTAVRQGFSDTGEMLIGGHRWEMPFSREAGRAVSRVAHQFYV